MTLPCARCPRGWEGKGRADKKLAVFVSGVNWRLLKYHMGPGWDSYLALICSCNKFTIKIQKSPSSELKRTYFVFKKHCGLKASALNSGLSGPGSSLSRGVALLCVLRRDTSLYLSQCLSPPRCIRPYKWVLANLTFRANPTIVSHSIGGGEEGY